MVRPSCQPFNQFTGTNIILRSFRYHNPDDASAEPVISRQWYTIDTFFLSFGLTEPVCVRQEDNPNSRIRSALFVLYFVFFVLSFTLQISYRSYDKETKLRNREQRRMPVSGADPDALRPGGMGMGTGSSLGGPGKGVSGLGMGAGVGTGPGTGGVAGGGDSDSVNPLAAAAKQQPGSYSNISGDSVVGV